MILIQCSVLHRQTSSLNIGWSVCPAPYLKHSLSYVQLGTAKNQYRYIPGHAQRGILVLMMVQEEDDGQVNVLYLVLSNNKQPFRVSRLRMSGGSCFP